MQNREPRCVRVGLIGDFNPANRTLVAMDAALQHAGEALGVRVDPHWLPTPSLDGEAEQELARFDALWCAPASPYHSMAGALTGIRFARERGVPFLGTCGGFQHAVIEYARNVLGVVDADHEETNPGAKQLVIARLACSLVGRMGKVRFDPVSRVARLYGRLKTTEQYHCNFGVSPQFHSALHDGGLRLVGFDDEGSACAVELPSHRFFIATLFLPQLTSATRAPHPLIRGLLEAARSQSPIWPAETTHISTKPTRSKPCRPSGRLNAWAA